MNKKKISLIVLLILLSSSFYHSQFSNYKFNEDKQNADGTTGSQNQSVNDVNSVDKQKINQNQIVPASDSSSPSNSINYDTWYQGESMTVKYEYATAYPEISGWTTDITNYNRDCYNSFYPTEQYDDNGLYSRYVLNCLASYSPAFTSNMEWKVLAKTKGSLQMDMESYINNVGHKHYTLSFSIDNQYLDRNGYLNFWYRQIYDGSKVTLDIYLVNTASQTLEQVYTDYFSYSSSASYMSLRFNYLWYIPASETSQVRTEYRYTSSTSVISKLKISNFDYNNILKVYYDSSRYNFGNINPLATVSASGGVLSITDTIPIVYEIDFTSTIKNYLPLKDVTDKYLQCPDFECGSTDTGWGLATKTINNSIVYSGSSSLKAETSASNDIGWNATTLKYGDYILQVSYYIETAPNSLRFYYGSSPVYLDISQTNRWLTTLIPFHFQGNGGYGIFFYFNNAGSVILLDNMRLWQSDATIQTISKNTYNSSATFRNIDFLKNPVVSNLPVQNQVYIRSNSTLIQTENVTTNENGIASYTLKRQLYPVEYNNLWIPNPDSYNLMLSKNTYATYKFDSNTFDSSPNSNDFIEHGTIAYTSSFNVGNSLIFDGSTTYLGIPSPSWLLDPSGESFSFDFTFEVTTLTGKTQYILTTGSQTASTGIAVMMLDSYEFRVTAKSQTAVYGLTGYYINLNTKYHLFVQFDDTHNIMMITLNDETFIRYGTSLSSTATLTDLTVGTANNAQGNYLFAGYMDNLRFYHEYVPDFLGSYTYYEDNQLFNQSSYFTPSSVDSILLPYSQSGLKNQNKIYWDFSSNTAQGFSATSVTNGYLVNQSSSVTDTTFRYSTNDNVQVVDLSYYQLLLVNLWSNVSGTVYIDNSTHEASIDIINANMWSRYLINISTWDSSAELYITIKYASSQNVEARLDYFRIEHLRDYYYYTTSDSYIPDSTNSSLTYLVYSDSNYLGTAHDLDRIYLDLSVGSHNLTLLPIADSLSDQTLLAGSNIEYDYTVTESDLTTITIVDQQGKYIDARTFDIYLDTVRIRSDTFLWLDTSQAVNITITDRWGNMLYQNTSQSFSRFLDLVLTLYSVKIYNQMDSPAYVYVTNGPTYSEWILPGEIVEYKLYSDNYNFTLQYSNTATGFSAATLNGTVTSFIYSVTADTALVIHDFSVQDVYNNLLSLSDSLSATNSSIQAAIHNQTNNITISIDNTNTKIDSQTNQIQIYIDNTNSSLSTQLNSIDTTIFNNRANFTIQMNNLNSQIVSINSTTTTQINSIKTLIANFETSMDSQLNNINATVINNRVNATLQFNSLNVTIANNLVNITGQLNDVDLEISNVQSVVISQANTINTNIHNINATLYTQSVDILSSIYNSNSTLYNQSVSVLTAIASSNSTIYSQTIAILSSIDLSNSTQVMLILQTYNLLLKTGHVHFDLVNLVGVGIPWETVKVLVNQSRIYNPDQFYDTGTFLNVTVISFWNATVTNFNRTVTAKFNQTQDISITIPLYLQYLSNKDQVPISVHFAGDNYNSSVVLNVNQSISMWFIAGTYDISVIPIVTNKNNGTYLLTFSTSVMKGVDLPTANKRLSFSTTLTATKLNLPEIPRTVSILGYSIALTMAGLFALLAIGLGYFAFQLVSAFAKQLGLSFINTILYVFNSEKALKNRRDYYFQDRKSKVEETASEGLINLPDKKFIPTERRRRKNKSKFWND